MRLDLLCLQKRKKAPPREKVKGAHSHFVEKYTFNTSKVFVKHENAHNGHFFKF
jgi:hypothetical protein